MIKVLVCWEDRFHEELDRCLRRALRQGAIPSLDLYFDDARGNGGFVPYLQRDWPKLTTKGLPKSGGPIDFLLCVADADRATDCCTIERPPMIPMPTAPWVERANKLWTDVLRSATTLHPSRIFGHFIRWNQESLLLAAHDVEAVMKRLGCRDLGAVTKHLRACKPSPLDMIDASFVEHYRNTGRCLDDLLRAAHGGAFRKGGQPARDALDEASRIAIARLCARVPDLAGLAEQVRSFA